MRISWLGTHVLDVGLKGIGRVESIRQRKDFNYGNLIFSNHNLPIMPSWLDRLLANSNFNFHETVASIFFGIIGFFAVITYIWGAFTNEIPILDALFGSICFMCPFLLFFLSQLFGVEEPNYFGGKSQSTNKIYYCENCGCSFDRPHVAKRMTTSIVGNSVFFGTGFIANRRMKRLCPKCRLK